MRGLKRTVLKDEIWITKSGLSIPVSELSLDHCHNIIRLLVRSGILEEIEDSFWDQEGMVINGSDQFGSLE